MPDRQLITPADILHAAEHRLREWTPGQIAEVRCAIETAKNDLHADEIIGALPIDGRDPWSAFCALLSISAHEIGDMDAFYRYGYTVLQSHRQAQRASGTRQGDALDSLIRDYLDELPGVTPKTLWDDFQGLAVDGFHPVLTDFDELGQLLSYAPSQYAEAVTIGFSAFRKRVQRNRHR